MYLTPKAKAVLLTPKRRYRVLYGGRGGSKSFAFADTLIFRAAHEKLRVLCTREMQNSIKDSVYRLLCDRIAEMGLAHKYTIRKDGIYSRSGSEILFKGLRHNITEIKSTEGIDICWVEEAEKVSSYSWDILIPTIRKEDSEIWISFNPEDEKSATYQRFVVDPPPSCIGAHLTYKDNPFFSDALKREMEYDKRTDYEKYLHVWEGQVKKYGEACIFHNKIVVESFETPEDARFYFGADWGFSVDPTCLVRCFVQDNCLMIDWEFYGHGVELTELETGFDSVPQSRKWTIRADSQRPDTISYMRQKGFNIVGAEKGKGSVEDGIEYLRGFEKIVIHPRCKGAIDNFTNYRWKQDRATNEILPIPLDSNNHVPDAIRYALEKLIKQKELSIRWL